MTKMVRRGGVICFLLVALFCIELSAGVILRSSGAKGTPSDDAQQSAIQTKALGAESGDEKKLEEYEKTEEGRKLLDSLADIKEDEIKEVEDAEKGSFVEAAEPTGERKLEQYEETEEGHKLLDSLEDIKEDEVKEVEDAEKRSFAEAAEPTGERKLEQYEETDKGRDLLDTLGGIGDDEIEEVKAEKKNESFVEVVEPISGESSTIFPDNDSSIQHLEVPDVSPSPPPKQGDTEATNDGDSNLSDALNTLADSDLSEAADDKGASSFVEEGSAAWTASLLGHLNRMYAKYPKLENSIHVLKKHINKKFKLSGKNSLSNDAVALKNIEKIKKANRDPHTGKFAVDIKERLVRPDLFQTDAEFFENGKRLGLKTQESGPVSMALYKHLMKMRGIDLDQPPAPLPASLGESGCKESDSICDRRATAKSCEVNIPITDQGSCGSCWAFANGHLLSIYQCQKTGRYVNFSVQQMLDCSEFHCEGGYQSGINKWLAETQHWASEEEYPYEGVHSKCRADRKKSSWLAEVDSSQLASSSLIEVEEGTPFSEVARFLKQAISHFGGAVIHVNHLDIRFAGTVPLSHCERRNDRSHAVLVTGWNKEAGEPNDPKADTTYFFARNSWDKWYGRGGYLHFYSDMKTAKCSEEMKPFFFIELPLVTGNISNAPQPKPDNIPGYSYAMTASMNSDIDCSRKRKNVTIISAVLGLQDTFSSKCFYDVTSVLKDECEGRDFCTIKLDELASNGCGNKLYVRLECGDPRDTFVEDEQKREAMLKITKKDFDNKIEVINCNQAEPAEKGGANAGECVQFCTEAKTFCNNVACLADATDVGMGSHDACDYSYTTKQDLPVKRVIDCSLVQSRGTLTREDCVNRCIETKRDHKCTDTDMICMGHAFRVEKHLTFCDISPAWRDRTAIMSEDIDCNAVTSTTKFPRKTYACKRHCKWAKETCRERTAECVYRSFLTESLDHCDFSSFRLSTAISSSDSKREETRPPQMQSLRDRSVASSSSYKRDIKLHGSNVSTKLHGSNVSTKNVPAKKATNIKAYSQDNKVDCNAAHLYPDSDPSHRGDADDVDCIKTCASLLTRCRGDSNCFIGQMRSIPESHCNLHAATTGGEPVKHVECEDSKAVRGTQATDYVCRHKCKALGKECSSKDYICHLDEQFTAECSLPWVKKKGCPISA